MIAFRVQLNGGEPVTAGVSGRDVASVIATSAVRDRRHRPNEPPIDLKLWVGGLRRTAEGIQGSLQWLERPLRVSDEIVIRVVDVGDADVSPVQKETTMAELTENAEKEELAYLIRKYGVS